MPSDPRTLRLHEAASARGDAGYVDPGSGLMVLTSAYLRRKGYCCGSGCRHCPYLPAEQAAAGRPADAECWRS